MQGFFMTCSYVQCGNAKRTDHFEREETEDINDVVVRTYVEVRGEIDEFSKTSGWDGQRCFSCRLACRCKRRLSGLGWN